MPLASKTAAQSMELAELAELPSLLAAQSMELAELAELLSLSNTRESMAGLGPLERTQRGWANLKIELKLTPH